MPGTTPQLPFTPYRLHDVFKRRDRLLTLCLDEYDHVEVTGLDLRELSCLLQSGFPKYVDEDILFRSIRHLSGQLLDEDILRNECWRLAGNYLDLTQGRPVPPWTHQRYREWVPLQVVECRLCRVSRRKIGAELDARCLAGTPCTEICRFRWTTDFARGFSIHLGFTPSWKDYPLRMLEQLVGLRFYGQMEPPDPNHEYRQGLYFDKMQPSAACLNYNRKLIRARRRLGFKCPRGYRHPCHKCYVGYRECPVATHPVTFILRTCRECGRDQWMDPRQEAIGFCIACRHKKDLSE